MRHPGLPRHLAAAFTLLLLLASTAAQARPRPRVRLRTQPVDPDHHLILQLLPDAADVIEALDRDVDDWIVEHCPSGDLLLCTGVVADAGATPGRATVAMRPFQRA